MPERTTWQVKDVTAHDWEDLGDWEPFGVGAKGQVLVRRQTMIEGEKSSVGHELSFAQRFPDDNHPED